MEETRTHQELAAIKAGELEMEFTEEEEEEIDGAPVVSDRTEVAARWLNDSYGEADWEDLTELAQKEWLLDASGALALISQEQEPVGWAPIVEDEDIPDERGGLLYGPGGTLTAFYQEEDARKAWPKYKILPVYLHPKPSGEATDRSMVEVLEDLELYLGQNDIGGARGLIRAALSSLHGGK